MSPTDTPRKRLMDNYHVKIMWKGLLVALPTIVIVILLVIVFNVIFAALEPLSRVLYPGSAEPHWLVNVLSFLVLVLFFYLVGIFVNKQSGREYFNLFEAKYLSKVPLYMSIREMLQQFTGLKKMPFEQTVLIDPYGTGVLLTGFVVEEATEDIYTIFVPTAPNPTNGNVFHVPVSQITFLNVKADRVIRTVIGVGSGSSHLFDTSSRSGVQPKEIREPL